MRQMQDGIGEGIEGAAGAEPLAFLAVILVIGVLVVVARHIVPSIERVRLERERNSRELRERELDIEQRRAETDAERVRANAMLAEQQRQTNVLIDGMRQSLDTSTAHTDVLVAELRGSRERSHEMGERVDRIDSTTQHTDALVEDIHRHIVGGEGTD